jgi:2-dehydro-3-deoxyphosphogluconate aldolase / (4S)-4-hydroxy-2-oxoglutarate aldolase
MIEQVKKAGIVAIIRGDFPFADYVPIAEALVEGGITALELTLNSTGALEAIALLRERFDGRAFIGAGTIRRVSQVDDAINAGAQFLVSPAFNMPSVVRSQELGILHLPGVATPTEAENAFISGCRALKLFPCDVLGGPAYLKAIRAPLDDIDFIPTGGITPDNVAAYKKAGAVAVGAGSSLVALDWTHDELVRRGRAFREAWDA